MRSDALRALISLLRSGESLRLALRRWPGDAPLLSADLIRVARVIRLGFPVPIALRHLDAAFGVDARAIRSIVAMHDEVGGDLATMLERLATAMDRREAWASKGRAMAAGMTASARLVAVLPLFFLPAGPAAGASLADPITLLLLAGGVGLTWIGLRWIRRLLPSADPPYGVDMTIGLLSAALAGGVDHHRALHVCARRAEGEWAGDLKRAARRVKLGMSWSQALVRCDPPDLIRLGEAIEISIERGVPPQHALGELENRLISRAEDRYAAAILRAPVRMVLPLTLCILPAYGILAAAPFLRAIAA